MKPHAATPMKILKQLGIYLAAACALAATPATAQNYLLERMENPAVFTMTLGTLDSLNVREIKVYQWMTNREIASFPFKQGVHSKVSVYKYDGQGHLKEQTNSYSGIDSTGRNHITENSPGAVSEFLSNGTVYYYNKEFKITGTLSYGMNVKPNSGYIYDHEGQLVMIRYYYDKVIYQFSESAGRTIFDYYPQRGKLRYKMKLDEKGQVEEQQFYFYDNYWDLVGVSDSYDRYKVLPYQPYVYLGQLRYHQVTIDGTPLITFMAQNTQSIYRSVLIQTSPEDWVLLDL